MKRKTWKQRIGKRLLAHVQATTQGCTLAEVKRNVNEQRQDGDKCFACERIAAKLGWPSEGTV